MSSIVFNPHSQRSQPLGGTFFDQAGSFFDRAGLLFAPALETLVSGNLRNYRTGGRCLLPSESPSKPRVALDAIEILIWQVYQGISIVAHSSDLFPASLRS